MRRVAVVVGVAATSVDGFPHLEAIDDDVAVFEDLVRDFDDVVVLTSDATVERVHHEIVRWHDVLAAGDQFVLAFSGHGSRRRSDDPFEVDGHSEALVLVDGRFEDRFLRPALHGFDPGVFVYALIDACHASGVTFLAPPEAAATGHVYRRGYATVGATSLTFAAAPERELARQTERGGQLVDAMRRAWDGGQFSGTWGEFWSLTSRWSVGLLQRPSPQAWIDGPDLDDRSILDQPMRSSPGPTADATP